MIFNKVKTVNYQQIYRIGTISFLLTGIGIVVGTSSIIKDNFINKQSALMAKSGNRENALLALAPLSEHLSAYESYWANFANILLANRNYKGAIEKFKEAKLLTSEPMVYRNIAICYERIGKYAEARDNLIILENMEPNHLAARFALMNIYLKMADTSSAIGEGRKILEISPKIPSRITNSYKTLTMRLINQLGFIADTRYGKLQKKTLLIL